MLTVGASSTHALFVLVSCARACPMRSTRSVFHVEASTIPAGKQVAFTPPLKLHPPRAPLGPSDIFKAGIPSRLIAGMRHISEPASSETFSSRVICPSRFSTVSCMIAFPFSCTFLTDQYVRRCNEQVFYNIAHFFSLHRILLDRKSVV